jgi:aspartate carbamoyltransferase catalytic subunit
MMTAKPQPVLRHVVSINDLTNKEIETVFDVAQAYLDELPDPRLSYRIGRSTNIASKSILATLFYEPSTRTRLSFESAMLRLGGDVITSADPATSSAAKGESLADSVRVVSNYADVIVIRHPRDGAARLAAEYASIPVINGGDGAHEHPTQTLCDLFTLKRKHKQLKNLKVAISGDLRGSRTIHSFVYALARFGAIIDPMAAPGMELPAHVHRRLKEEYRCELVSATDESGTVDAMYVTPDEPHQQSLFSGTDVDHSVIMRKKIDAVYVTRFQKERWADKDQEYPRIDAKFLKDSKYSHASVMHPLPRVNELDAAFDSDSRAMYFQQAAYGVPIRMALISLLLSLRADRNLQKFENGFEALKEPLYNHPLTFGIRCANKNCISHEPMEAQYVANKFHVIRNGATRLRCFYCENDIEHFVVGHRKQTWFAPDTSLLSRPSEPGFKDLVAFAAPEDAIAAGYHLKQASPKRASS